MTLVRSVDVYPKPPAGIVQSDFVGEGTFPLMKLPQEIRFEIYKLVLAPLLSKRRYIPDGKRHLVLEVQPFRDEYYEDMHYMVGHVIRGFYNFPTHLTLEDYVETESQNGSELEKNYRQVEAEVAALCKRFIYPSFTRAYEITYPRYKIETPNRRLPEKIPSTHLAAIRNLSNVSCQVRKELGICVLTSLLLVVDRNAYVEALLCLRDRPAIHTGVKAMSIHVRWVSETDWPDGSAKWACSMVLVSLVQFMNRHLKLDQMIIRLELLLRYKVQEFLDAAESLEWIGALQGLTCARHFTFETTYTYVCPEDWLQPAKLEEGSDGRLEGLWRPYILTESDTVSEGKLRKFGSSEYKYD